MKIGFAGGAMEVGGSCIFLRTESYGILMDSGIRQGGKKDPLPDFRMLQEMGGVDAILISHAHMDHIGALPLISRAYPDARIYMTPMTMDLTRVLLLDSLKIMTRREEEIPIYSETEVSAMMDRITPLHYEVEWEILPEIRVTLYPAGHIAGAACICLQTPEGTVFYSGDFASFAQQTIEGLRIRRLRPDLCITEATYGNRLHANRQVEENRLIRLTQEALAGGGKVLIPCFALGRAQEVILLLRKAIRDGVLPKVPVYVDGMVREICRVFRLHPTYLQGKLARAIQKGNDPFYSDEIQPVSPAEDREALLEKPGPAVFVASSGMLTGGPSVIYAKKIAMMENGLILITGYQDEEAPGRALLSLAEPADQDDKVLSLDGQSIPVRARVEQVGLSAHADQQEILNLISALSPRDVFLVHGDPDSIGDLAARVTGEYLRDIYTPECGETVSVDYRNPRKQYRPSLSAVMGETGFPDAAGEERLWLFVQQNYPHREMTAIELSQVWSGEAASLDTEIQSWQDLLLRSVYFAPNPRRLFLFHPESREDVEKALAPREMNQQEVGEKAQEFFSAFGFSKAGYYLDRKTVVLTFPFPDAVDRVSFAEKAQQFFSETGWHAEINPATNHTRTREKLNRLFGDRINRLSCFEAEKTYRIELRFPDPEDDSRAGSFETETGWKLTMTVRADNSVGSPCPPAEEWPSGEKMEQNAAMAYIRQTCDDLGIPLQKMGVKNDNAGKYLELTFISPAIAKRYEEEIGKLSLDTGWRLIPSKNVLQNLVLPIAAEAVNAQGLTLQKNPSYLPMSNSVQIRLCERDAEKEAVIANLIMEKTGLTCSFL